MEKMLAVAQMTATEDVEKNFLSCKNLAKKAASHGVQLLALPENFAFLGEDSKQTKKIAQPLTGEWFQSYCRLAKEFKIWISFGGFQEKSADHIFNSHVIVDNTGKIRAAYRKVHLFSIDIPTGLSLDESKINTSGDQLVIAKSPLGQLGLSICYDLRFGRFYTALAEQGAQILLVPAAFTSTTGKAHWETLLRARAIETQCYVAAPAQTGVHNPKRKSHGHAMIIDPWGQVIAQCSEGDNIAFASINLEYLSAVRQRIPILKHQRYDVYQKAAIVYE